jgi:ubiquinone/menaquinone biosynthesis C-methylase UbiE
VRQKDKADDRVPPAGLSQPTRTPVDVTPARVQAGQAAYTPWSLKLYDMAVLGFNSRFFWGCPRSRLRVHFDAHVSANHLDVGVGTGYFLDRASFPVASPRLVLMDLNSNSLEYSRRRLARYDPVTIEHNVLEPYRQKIEPFDSLSMNYLLHCIPGSLFQKRVVFEHLLALLKPGGVLFGATILSQGVHVPLVARTMMRVNQKQGVINNEADHLDELREVLEHTCDRSVVKVHGTVGVFAGWKANTAGHSTATTGARS